MRSRSIATPSVTCGELTGDERRAAHLTKPTCSNSISPRCDDGRGLRIVGNLPYNISTPLLFRLIEQREHILDMHFMLQKEVVDRMAAAPAIEHYGRLTVMLAPWLRVEPLFDIGPGAFRPPPRVMSTFVRLAPHATRRCASSSRAAIASVVAAAFSQRRKTLRNALKPLLTPGRDPSRPASIPVRAPRVIAACGIRRPGGAAGRARRGQACRLRR